MRWRVQTADLVSVREHGVATTLVVCLLVSNVLFNVISSFWLMMGSILDDPV